MQRTVLKKNRLKSLRILYIPFIETIRNSNHSKRQIDGKLQNEWTSLTYHDQVTWQDQPQVGWRFKNDLFRRDGFGMTETKSRLVNFSEEIWPQRRKHYPRGPFCAGKVILMMPFIDFEPIGRRVPCTSGETILEAAQRAGIMLNATCGGEGICGHCIVRVMAGTVSLPNKTEEIDLGLNRVNDHWRLACQTKIMGDVRIHIPPESLATARTQTEGRNIPRS